jgi:hypothetical protein
MIRAHAHAAPGNGLSFAPSTQYKHAAYSFCAARNKVTDHEYKHG